MPTTMVLTILSTINQLLALLSRAPETKQQIEDLLSQVAAHVNAAGKDAQAAYIAAKQRLVDPRQPLVDPMTGISYDV